MLPFVRRREHERALSLLSLQDSTFATMNQAIGELQAQLSMEKRQSLHAMKAVYALMDIIATSELLDEFDATQMQEAREAIGNLLALREEREA